MTRTAIRYTLFALAAVALFSASAAGPASAQSSHTHDIWRNDVTINVAPSTGATYSKPKTSKGLAAKKGPQAITSIISGFNSVNR